MRPEKFKGSAYEFNCGSVSRMMLLTPVRPGQAKAGCGAQSRTKLGSSAKQQLATTGNAALSMHAA